MHQGSLAKVSPRSHRLKALPWRGGLQRAAALLAVLASLGLPALAEDGPLVTLDWHGYIRAGSGTSTEGGEMAAFQLPGAPSKFRLGNEAENYGEFGIDSKVFSQGGKTFKAHIMFQFYHPFALGSNGVGVGSNSTLRTFDMNQYWVEGIGVLGESEALKNASLWAGKRYYNRNENHIEITDFFYWNDYGNGLGVENVNLGFGKFHYAYITYDNSNGLSPASSPTRLEGQNIVTAHAFRLSDLAVNPNGRLELGVTFMKARPYSSVSNATNSNNGVEFNVQHKQAKVLGGDNMLGFQYGTGSASTLNQPAGANPALGSGHKAWRVVDNLTVEQNKRFAMQVVALYQSSQDPTGARSTWTSFGGRPMLFVNKNFSVVLDAGLDRVKYGAAGDTGQLLKTTLALVWRPEAKFWSVPQFRLFVTNGQWNDAAAAAGPIANGTFGNKRSGTNYGLQGEIWW